MDGEERLPKGRITSSRATLHDEPPAAVPRALHTMELLGWRTNASHCSIRRYTQTQTHIQERETTQANLTALGNMRVLAVLTFALVAFAAVGVHAEEAPAEQNLRKNGNNNLLVPKTSSHLSDVIARIKAQLGLAHSHKDMVMESAQAKKNKKINKPDPKDNFMLESKQQKKQHSQ